ncbi:hypothetical protein BZB76_6821, partial [Actinomadura pelletieri DSM 43383]
KVASTAEASPVLVAYPLGYDWMFLYWYWMRFTDTGSPFGHSRHLDLKSLYAAKGRRPHHVSHHFRCTLPPTPGDRTPS